MTLKTLSRLNQPRDDFSMDRHTAGSWWREISRSALFGRRRKLAVFLTENSTKRTKMYLSLGSLKERTFYESISLLHVNKILTQQNVDNMKMISTFISSALLLR